MLSEVLCFDFVELGEGGGGDEFSGVDAGANELPVEQFFKVFGVVCVDVLGAVVGIGVHVETEVAVGEVREERGEPGGHASISVANP